MILGLSTLGYSQPILSRAGVAKTMDTLSKDPKNPCDLDHRTFYHSQL